MADVTLSNGREVNIDLSKIKVREWQEMHNPAFSDDGDIETLAKVTGLTAEELKDLPMDEYNRLFFAVLRKVQNPIANPN